MSCASTRRDQWRTGRCNPVPRRRSPGGPASVRARPLSIRTGLSSSKPRLAQSLIPPMSGAPQPVIQADADSLPRSRLASRRRGLIQALGGYTCHTGSLAISSLSVRSRAFSASIGSCFRKIFAASITHCRSAMSFGIVASSAWHLVNGLVMVATYNSFNAKPLRGSR